MAEMEADDDFDNELPLFVLTPLIKTSITSVANGFERNTNKRLRGETILKETSNDLFLAKVFALVLLELHLSKVLVIGYSTKNTFGCSGKVKI